MKKNVYLLHGEEEFLIEEEILKIRKKLGIATASTAYQVFSDSACGPGIDFNNIINAIQSTTLFEPQKLLIISLTFLLKIFPESVEQQKLFFQALDNCPDSIILIFRSNGAVDFRKKAAK